jgi:hypothetical protein
MNRIVFKLLSMTYRHSFTVAFRLHLFPEAFQIIAIAAELYDKHYPEEDEEEGVRI